MPTKTVPKAPPTRTVGVERATTSIVHLLTPLERDRADRIGLYAVVARTSGAPSAVIATANKSERLIRAAVEVARTFGATLAGYSEPPPLDPRTAAACHCGADVQREIAMVGARPVPYWLHSGASYGSPHAARPGLAVSA